jgi:hypothetical protein
VAKQRTTPEPVVTQQSAEATRHPSGVELMSIEQLAERFGRSKKFFEDLILNDPLFPAPKADGYSAVEVASFLRDQPSESEPEQEFVTEVFDGTLKIQFARPNPASFISRANGHLDVKLNPEQELPGLRFYLGALIQQGAKMPDGKPVSNQREAIRYLFRQITAEMKQKCPLTPSAS